MLLGFTGLLLSENTKCTLLFPSLKYFTMNSFLLLFFLLLKIFLLSDHVLPLSLLVVNVIDKLFFCLKRNNLFFFRK